mgnify:CR=1 FL=1
MSFDELVQQYRNRIESTSNKKAELERILQEINHLTYSQTGEPISQETKREILEALRVEVVQESSIRFAQDNSEFLKLLDTTIKALGGK